MADAQKLIPSWSLDDFMGEAPYKWLYENRQDKFLLQILLQKTQAQAKALKFPGFTKMWNAYLESKSPKQVVLGENQTLFDGQPMVLRSGKYTCDENGVRYLGRMGEEVTVCAHPLMPSLRVINMDTSEEKLQISYFRSAKAGGWRTAIVSKDVLASSQKIIGLAKIGIGVNSENAKELVKFIGDMEDLNYDALDTQQSTSHLGWLPDGQFAPYCDRIVYDGESPEFKRMFDGFKPTGDRDEWMRIAKEVRSGSSVPARIALAASFAAPLVKPLGALPFFVHLWGTQGCGKTVGLMLAASVWGNPDVGQYIKTFGGTKVAQELYAAFCGSVPICLDELQIIKDRNSFDDIIYMLCEGTSKGRGAKDGGLQTQRHWASTIITTAEMPIVQSNSGGGAAVRTIEVNYGGEPLFSDARAVANALKSTYGHAGPEYIEALQNKDTIEVLRTIQKKFYDQLTGDIQDKQVLSASILLAADKLADIALFHDGKALTVDDVKPYLITRDQADVNNRAYQWLAGFIAGNPRRFDDPDNQNGEQWGVIEHGVVYFNRTYFEKVLRSEGYSPSSFLVWADRNGKIEKENYGVGNKNNRLTKRKRYGGRHVTCVALILPDDEEQQQKDVSVTPEGYVVVNDDKDMPF